MRNAISGLLVLMAACGAPEVESGQLPVASSNDLVRTLFDVNQPHLANARCNDGTPAGYYIRDNGSDSWVIYMQGGWNCRTVAECNQRYANSPALMSSNPWPATMNTDYGIISTHRSNPFAKYNHVYVRYCTSDFFSGDRAADASTGGWQFRGKAVIDALIAELGSGAQYATPLRKAREVIFGGSSAGGVAALANADYLRKRVAGDVGVIVSAGFGKDLPGDTTLEDYLQVGYDFWQGRPNQKCVAANPGREGLCYTAVTAPFIKTSLFVQQQQYDSAVLSLYGISHAPPWNRTDAAIAENSRRTLITTLLQLKPSDAVLSRHAYGHGAPFHGINFDQPIFQQYSLRDMLVAWRAGSPLQLIE